jgi:hypothetical protein
MAVRAQEAEVGTFVVVEVAVDVVDLQPQRLALPGAIDAAQCAFVGSAGLQ